MDVQVLDTAKRKRGQRGPGKRPPLMLITMRIKPETLEFFQQFDHPRSHMGAVLDAYAKRRTNPVD